MRSRAYGEPMDLDSYELTDLISYAILSEIHSRDLYQTQSGKVTMEMGHYKLLEHELDNRMIASEFNSVYPNL